LVEGLVVESQIVTLLELRLLRVGEAEVVLVRYAVGVAAGGRWRLVESSWMRRALR
jgi:hypothetical protein